MDDGMDYEVHTRVSFRLIFDGNGEMNLLSLPEIRQGFVNHVKEVYERDETLRDYVSGDLSFQFISSTALLEYTFSCCDEDEAEAESRAKRDGKEKRRPQSIQKCIHRVDLLRQ